MDLMVSKPHDARFVRITILSFAALYLVIWLLKHLATFTATSNDQVRLILGGVFFLLVLLRKKTLHKGGKLPERALAGYAVLGTALVLGGVVFTVNQFQWLGLMLLVFACFHWALPPHYSQDVGLAVFLLYWIHPLPSRVFHPLQVFMQRLSIMGSEWLLHCVNVRVWADGMILQTGYRAFEVPESCSGMLTVTTVTLSCIGIGILFRFTLSRILILTFAGLVQTLALNILRISMVVRLSLHKPPDWSGVALHDTTGLFLLAAIVLVQIEAAACNRLWNPKSRRSDVGPTSPVAFRIVYGFSMPRLNRWVVAAIAGVVILSGIVLAIDRSLPEHRAALIGGVAESLATRDLARAERASIRAVELRPHDTEHRLRYVRILLQRQKYRRARDELELVPKTDRTAKFVIMQCWALVGTEEKPMAMAVLESLPADLRNHPGIAMTAAEFAAGENDLDAAIRDLMRAAQSPVFIHRVRNMFKYLAANGQWQVITDLDRNIPHRDQDELLMAVTAHILTSNRVRAESALHRNRDLWLGDPRFSEHLFTLAGDDTRGTWRDLFVLNVRESLDTSTPGQLCDCFAPAFALRRPDVAWLTYHRLQVLDPEHPALFLMPVQFDADWFTFLKSDLQFKTAARDETIDVRSNLQLLNDRLKFALEASPPLLDELTVRDTSLLRDEYLRRCLDEFKKRSDPGGLSYQMNVLHAKALELAGRTADAHVVLDLAMDTYPNKKDAVLLQHARLYNEEGRWQESYETLRNFCMSGRLSGLKLDLVMIDTLMYVNLGLYAMTVAEKASRIAPDSSGLNSAIAAIWEVFGYNEQALHILRGSSDSVPSIAVARLLEKTGRYETAHRARLFLGLPEAGRVSARMWILPSAESAVAWVNTPPPTKELTGHMIERLRARIETDTSPFIRELNRATMEWHLAGGENGTSDLERWRGIGRDDNEKAVCLHKLALLLARQNAKTKALEAIEQAIGLMPTSGILWRMRIALREGDTTIVKEARQVCPEDPEIWLAWLVSMAKERGSDFDADAEIREAIVDKHYSPGSFIRAGDFLVRAGRLEAANTAASHALKHSEGFLPAIALMVKCAIASGNTRLAMACSLRACDMAPDPWPFQKVIVALKMDGNSHDMDLIRRLQVLTDRFPAEAEWRLRLGATHFYRGDMATAWSVFGPVVKEYEEDIDPGSLLLAAESARLSRHQQESLLILRKARSRYPDNIHVLNNLVFALAQSPDTLHEARDLVPDLLRLDDSASVYDTASIVYHRCGLHAECELNMRKALERVSPDDFLHWRQIHLNAAEIQWDLGKYEQSRKIMDALLRDGKAALRSDNRVVAFLQKLEALEKEPEPVSD